MPGRRSSYTPPRKRKATKFYLKMNSLVRLKQSLKKAGHRRLPGLHKTRKVAATNISAFGKNVRHAKNSEGRRVVPVLVGQLCHLWSKGPARPIRICPCSHACGKELPRNMIFPFRISFLLISLYINNTNMYFNRLLNSSMHGLTGHATPHIYDVGQKGTPNGAVAGVQWPGQTPVLIYQQFYYLPPPSLSEAQCQGKWLHHRLLVLYS